MNVKDKIDQLTDAHAEADFLEAGMNLRARVIRLREDVTGLHQYLFDLARTRRNGRAVVLCNEMARFIRASWGVPDGVRLANLGRALSNAKLIARELKL